MAHSFPSSAAAPDESAPSAIRRLRPRSELALENFLTFYASRKVSTDEWNGRSVIGILELLQLWVQHGDAVVLFETYESYLESVGELVAAFGGTFADVLRPSQMDAEPRDVLAAILYERESQPCLPRLHPAIRRETFDSARRLRTLRSLVN